MKAGTAVVVVLAVIAVGVVSADALLATGRVGGGGTGVNESQLGYLTISTDTPVMGSAKAPVTIFEFGDFQCPTCDQWYKTQEPMVVQGLVDTGDAKLAWKDFDYFGNDSFYASEAAYSAGAQGEFWQFYDLLYTDQQTPNNGWASPSNLASFAEGLGLNMSQFNSSFDTNSFSSIISSNIAAGKALGVSGTPTFFVVGPTGKVVEIVGAQPYSVFQQAVTQVGG